MRLKLNLEDKQMCVCVGSKKPTSVEHLHLVHRPKTHKLCSFSSSNKTLNLIAFEKSKPTFSISKVESLQNPIRFKLQCVHVFL